MVDEELKNKLYDSDSDEWTCKCDETFDTLDELENHAEEKHPEVYEEKFS